MRFVTLALLLIASPAVSQSFLTLPKITPLQQTGSILLGWNPGDPPMNGLSNITTRAMVAFGFFNYYMVTGLPVGSTNSFVVFNTDAETTRFSNVATAVAEPYVPDSEVRIYSFMVTVPARTNGVTEILTSTNLNIWVRVASVTNAGPRHQFLWTNEGAASRFFRSVSP